MGILGLTNFLLRACPGVVKELPSRFKSLGGQTIALDGTLLTQRFHYGGVPHPHRHVLGWYRLINELRESDVKAICVFDGQGRHQAKTRELERRRDARKLVAGRASFEVDRFQRLAELDSLLERLDDADLPAKWKIVEGFQRRAHSPGSFSKPSFDSSQAIESSFPLVTSRVGRGVPRVYRARLAHLAEATLEAESTPEETAKSNDEASAGQRLAGLYEAYNQSTCEVLSSADVSPSFTAGAVDKDVALTKLQAELAQEEGAVWSAILHELSTGTSTPRLAEISERLHSLQQACEKLRLSYEKRADSPQTETYEESRTILTAMGIPILEADGVIEAEALASSLVINGVADLVGSEDTDVLIYEAPLVRGVTNRNGPLSIVDGADVRRALRLSRPAYIDFALLLGSDFSERITGLGPHTAMKLIRAFESIEAILNAEKLKTKGRKFSPEPGMDETNYLLQVAEARAVFQDLPVLSESMRARLSLPQVRDERAVFELLKEFGLGWGFQEDQKEDWNNFMYRDFFAGQSTETPPLEGNYI